MANAEKTPRPARSTSSFFSVPEAAAVAVAASPASRDVATQLFSLSLSLSLSLWWRLFPRPKSPLPLRLDGKSGAPPRRKGKKASEVGGPSYSLPLALSLPSSLAIIVTFTREKKGERRRSRYVDERK